MVVLLAFVLVFAGVIWVSPARGPKPIEFFTEMRELGGVSLETPVVLNGFKVGQVDKVDPYIAGDGRLGNIGCRKGCAGIRGRNLPASGGKRRYCCGV